MNNNKTIFYASLFGTKLAEKIPRLEMVNNKLDRLVLPPIPFIGKANDVEIAQPEHSFTMDSGLATPPNIEGQFFPLLFRRRKSLIPGQPSEQWYTFPYEPLISVTGRNIIAKKAPAKAKNFIGTVKERWSQDDYEITITGSVFGKNLFGTPETAFPREDFEKLRDYCTSSQGLEVKCDLLQMLGINYIVIDDFSYPFVTGENVMAYELKCSSDFTSELLLEIE